MCGKSFISGHFFRLGFSRCIFLNFEIILSEKQKLNITLRQGEHHVELRTGDALQVTCGIFDFDTRVTWYRKVRKSDNALCLEIH